MVVLSTTVKGDGIPNRSTPLTSTTDVGVNPVPVMVTIWELPTFSAFTMLGLMPVIESGPGPVPPSTATGHAFESEALPVPLSCTITSPGPAAAGIATVIDVPPPDEETPVTVMVG